MPESWDAFFKSSSSMFNVVRICINMHQLCIQRQDLRFTFGVNLIVPVPYKNPITLKSSIVTTINVR